MRRRRRRGRKRSRGDSGTSLFSNCIQYIKRASYNVVMKSEQVYSIIIHYT